MVRVPKPDPADIVRLALVAFLLSPLVACGDDDSPTVPEPLTFEELELDASLEIDKSELEMHPSGVYLLDRTVGEADTVVAAGDEIRAHYSFWLPDGTLIQATGGGDPLDITLELGRAIEGWIEGVPGMRPGGVRVLVIPPDLGYGSKPPGGLPPNTWLVYEVELVEIL